MRMKLFLAATAMVAAGMIGGGCADDDPSEATAGSVTKAEWIARADAICAEVKEGVGEAAGRIFPGLTAGTPAFDRKMREFVSEVVLPSLERQAAGVAALDAPEGDEERVDAIVSAVQAGIEEIRSDPAVAESPDGSLAEAARLSTAYGLKVCGAE